jgi:excisionase family DNA binding protein
VTAPLLTPEKIAEALGVSLAMVYKIIRQGLLPVVRIGTSVRVKPQDLDAYIESNRSTTPRKYPSNQPALGRTR